MNESTWKLYQIFLSGSTNFENSTKASCTNDIIIQYSFMKDNVNWNFVERHMTTTTALNFMSHFPYHFFLMISGGLSELIFRTEAQIELKSDSHAWHQYTWKVYRLHQNIIRYSVLHNRQYFTVVCLPPCYCFHQLTLCRSKMQAKKKTIWVSGFRESSSQTSHCVTLIFSNETRVVIAFNVEKNKFKGLPCKPVEVKVRGEIFVFLRINWKSFLANFAVSS